MHSRIIEGLSARRRWADDGCMRHAAPAAPAAPAPVAVAAAAGAPHRRGRSPRVSQTPTHGEVVRLRNRLGTYEPFAVEQIDRIEAHADRILDEVGVEFRGDDEALELFRAAGARVVGERVRFDPGLAAQLCATAPTQFEMYGRDRRSVPIGGDHVVFLPAYGSPFVTDPTVAVGTRRSTTSRTS